MVRSTTVAFLAWNLNAAIDSRTARLPETVEKVTDAIEQRRFVELIDEIDPSRPGGIVDDLERTSINEAVLDRYLVRNLKYAGARNDPGAVCMGFLLNLLSSPPEE